MPFRLHAEAAAEAAHDRALAAVRALAAPLCAAHAVDLVDIAWATEHGGRTLRVTIERRGRGDGTGESGWGVSLEDCAELSRDLSQALDHDDVVPGSYHLEVSSPGLERELSSIEDLIRFQGRLARVKLAKPAPDGQRVLRGTLVSVTGEGDGAELTMRVDAKDITVPVRDVVVANLVFEMQRSPRPNESRKRRPTVGGVKGRGS